MTVDQILNLAVKSIKAKMPEAIYQGSLVKQTNAFDAANSVARTIDEVVTPVEIVFDSFKSEELLGSNILSTNVKLIIIANEVKSIDFYSCVRIGLLNYTIKQLVESVVGSKVALFTIAAKI